MDSLAQEVEKEKMKAVGTRNLIKSMAKQREAKEQQYHVSSIFHELMFLNINHNRLFLLWRVQGVMRIEQNASALMD